MCFLSDRILHELLEILTLQDLVRYELRIYEELAEFRALFENWLKKQNDLFLNEKIVAIKENSRVLEMVLENHIECRLLFVVEILYDIFDVFPFDSLPELELVFQVEYDLLQTVNSLNLGKLYHRTVNQVGIGMTGFQFLEKRLYVNRLVAESIKSVKDLLQL